MKKIGFVDYYISEWHANNYPAWIKQVSDKMGENFEVKYAWAEMDVSPIDNKTTDEWCKEFGVEKCDTVEELCEKSDYIIVLAPSDPDTHLRLAEKVLKYKKNTYIDKTFAPDVATAQKIFDIAKENGTNFFSSSALRFSKEMMEVTGRRGETCVFGEGSNLDEYVIHIIEMTVAMQGVGATAIKLNRSYDNYMIEIKYLDDRKSTLIFAPGLPFKYVSFDGNSYKVADAGTDAFLGLMEAMLKFFNEGKVPFDTVQTMEVMKIRESVIKAKDKEGEWLTI